MTPLLRRALAIGATLLLAGQAQAAGSAGGPDVPPPQDRDFPGAMQLTVDARDVERRIVHVHESIEGLAGDAVLLYPQWLPGWHAPGGPIERLAGLSIHAGELTLPWTRDAVDVYAFHVRVPPGAGPVDVRFDYLAPTGSDTGSLEISRDMITLEMNRVVLYPAGYYASRIAVDARVLLPPGWSPSTALEPVPGRDPDDGAGVRYRRVSLETLVDSPLYAGRFFAGFDLDPGGRIPVRLDVYAGRPAPLAATPAQVDAHRALVRQAGLLFGSHHYAHYDFLLALGDDVEDEGLEHHESSANGASPDYFTGWDKSLAGRYLLPHELVHSWNGKFRRPADLWTPNYNVPMRNSLLWIYEGQTQYWSDVLSARSGLWTLPETLDALAWIAANLDARPGRRWRPLQDTTFDEILSVHTESRSWTTWQRHTDYYDEGLLIWLDADTLIRERSSGKRSLDDFARSFFGVQDGARGPVNYTLDDVVAALAAVEPHDWAGFFRARLDATGGGAPLDGVRRGGYTLQFDDTPGEYYKSRESLNKLVELRFSIGLTISEKDSTITEVLWDSPAYGARLIPGEKIVAVDGLEYGGDTLKDAIRAAAASRAPIELIVKGGDRYRVVRVDYTGGLRYPHLVRDPSRPALLDAILAPRT